MSGDLELNKILGAGLATALLILGLREVTDHMFAQEPPAKPGYAIQVAEDTSGGGPAKADTPPDWGTVLKTADIAAGQTVFGKCQSCHTNTQGTNGTVGPSLFGVVGRPVASAAATGPSGFTYSDAMKDHAKTTPVWTYDALYTYLSHPQQVVPGTKMGFSGDQDPTDRINLIAFLRSQGSTGYPIPAPDPKRQPAAAAPAAGAAGTTTAASKAVGQAGQAAAAAPQVQKSPTGAAAK